MKRTTTSTTGPDFTDLSQTANYIRTNYRHHTVVVMEPLANRTDQWSVRIIATYEPTNPAQALAAALKRPPGYTWSCQWGPASNHDLSSTLFRGYFELEIALSELIEQLELPV